MKHIAFLASFFVLTTAYRDARVTVPLLDAKEEVTRILSLFGHSVNLQSATIRTSTTARGVTIDEISVNHPRLGTVFCLYNRSTGKVTISSSLEWDRKRGLRRTGDLRWANESEARGYVQFLCNQLRGPALGRMARFWYSVDVVENGRFRRPGRVGAEFEFLVYGYPVNDHFCGFNFSLDPQDGALYMFESNPKTPNVSAPAPPISEMEARDRLRSVRTHLSQQDVLSREAVLGWATPTGESVPVLSYRFRSNERGRIMDRGDQFVEARVGGRVWSES